MYEVYINNKNGQIFLSTFVEGQRAESVDR